MILIRNAFYCHAIFLCYFVLFSSEFFIDSSFKPIIGLNLMALDYMHFNMGSMAPRDPQESLKIFNEDFFNWGFCF